MLFNAQVVYLHTVVPAWAGNKKWSFQTISFAINFPSPSRWRDLPQADYLGYLLKFGREIDEWESAATKRLSLIIQIALLSPIPLLHIGHSKPVEPCCPHSQPPGGLAQEVWPRSRTEGCALAATEPPLPNEFWFPGRIAPCSLFLIPTARGMTCWVMGFVIL